MMILEFAQEQLSSAQSTIFKDIYQKLYRYVAAIVMNVTHDETALKDVTHDVFVKYIEKFPTLPSLEESKAWLSVVARNTAIDWLRKRKKEKIHRLDNEDEFFRKIPSPDLVEEAVINKLETEHLYNQISKLDKKYYDVLLMRYKFDYTPEEIARIFDLKVKTVYTRLDRGKELLKKMYFGNERGEDDV